jgi:DDB1- and CUL4-associated factor 7
MSLGVAIAGSLTSSSVCLIMQIIQLDDEKGEIVSKGGFDHPYPATRIMWAPEAASRDKDLLATAGDYLRLWQVFPDGDTKMESLLNNNRNTEYCAPLTSFDWNELDPAFVGACSIDTTCTIWDLNVRKVKTQVSS